MGYKYDAESFNSGKALQDARKAIGKSQAQFSQMLGMSIKTLQNREQNADGDLRIRDYMRIAESIKWKDKNGKNYQGVDIDFLLGVQDMPVREDADIHAVTGLSQNAINSLKEDNNSESDDYVLSDVDSAKIVNSLFDTTEGRMLMITMQMYVIANNILKLHRESVCDMVSKVNEKYGQYFNADYVLRFTARKALAEAKQSAAVSGLNLFGRNQNKIENVRDSFIDKFKSEYFNKNCATIVYNYIEAEEQIKVLRHECYEGVIRMLDAVPSNPKNMNYNGSLKSMAEAFGFSDMRLKPASIDIENV